MTHNIHVEMNASVWKILVAPGDTITDGDEIAILESMKMEIPVLSDTDGVIVEIRAKEGEGINEGDILATLDVSSA